MTVEAITNGTVFDGESDRTDVAVLVESGKVAGIVPSAEIPPAAKIFDLEGGLLIPGFIDLQVNGGGGALFNQDASVTTIRRIGDAHRRFGTTGFLPTLVTTNYQTMRAGIAAVREAIRQGVPGVLGIHLEGPFLNPLRAGIHDAGSMCAPDEEGVQLLTSLDEGVTLVTLAPETVGDAMIRRLSEAGVVVSAGHTAASYERIRSALEAGLTGFTHLYNAMTPMSTREPGVVGAALEHEGSWFGIIADGHHSHPASFKAAVRAKRRGGALLITDAMPTVGSTADSFELAGRQIRLREGRCVDSEGTLAGAHLDMLTAVDNAARFAGVDWWEAVRMASLYPARALGLEAERGRIRPGARADLLALDRARRVRASWIDGDCRRFDAS